MKKTLFSFFIVLFGGVMMTICQINKSFNKVCLLLPGLLFVIVMNANAQFLFRISGHGLEKPSYILGMVGDLSIAHLDSLFGYTKVEAQCQQFCMDEEHDIFSHPSEGTTKLPDGKTIYDVLNKEQIEALDAGIYKVRHQRLADMFAGNFGSGWKHNKPHTYTCLFTFSILQEVRNRYPEEHGEQRDLKNEPLERAKLHGLKVWDIGYDNHTYYDNAYWGQWIANLDEQIDTLMAVIATYDQRLQAAIKEREEKPEREKMATLCGQKGDYDGYAAILPHDSNSIWQKSQKKRHEKWILHMQYAMPKASIMFEFKAWRLPGEHGIIQLLRDAGYTVEQMKP